MCSEVTEEDTEETSEKTDHRVASRLDRVAALNGSDIALGGLRRRRRRGDRKKGEECKSSDLVEQHCLREIKLVRLELW